MRLMTTAAITGALCLAVLSPFAFAADAKPPATDHNHEQPGPKAQDLTKVDAQMKRMREMHEKMMAAKTPEERSALMADHMKVMQDGMEMMQSMNSNPGQGGMSMSQNMMHKRMDMMETMMQMMMDRLSTGAMAPGK